MATPREQFLRLVNNDNQRWLGNPFDCFLLDANSGMPFLQDAAAQTHKRTGKGHVNVPDAWGVVWDWPADQPGPTPNTAGDKKVIKDIKRWKEFFDFPDLDNLDWSATDALAESADRETRLLMAQSPRGLFEFSHAMMGFEDALENYILEQDYMAELLSEYTDWKIKAAGNI